MPVNIIYDDTCTSTSGRCCLWTVPADVTAVTFELWGGGGGGGNGLTMCDCCSRTQGGGGGGYALKQITVVPGAQYTICAGNGGISTSGYGAPIGYCCNGCPGGTSFVLGAGITTLCATGGQGGCSNFTINCYGHCGCNGADGGQGFGGDINARGQAGVKGMAGSNACSSYSMGGVAGGPGGGVGGMNTGGMCYLGAFCYGSSDNNPAMHGSIPGGGGAGHGCWWCCICCDRGSGRGAPGAVKITW